MANILVLNGPNLNLLGTRDPERYGKATLLEIQANVQRIALEIGHNTTWKQSNLEGELVTWIQDAPRQQCAAIIINAAAYTHTSIAIRDAISAVQIPTIEVHLSNIYAREKFRHHSYLSDVVIGSICGLGPVGYELAVRAAHDFLKNKH